MVADLYCFVSQLPEDSAGNEFQAGSNAHSSNTKWLQHLALARLGLVASDLEWFLNLYATGRVIMCTPHQQSHMSLKNDMATEAMLEPLSNSFHLDRGIGQSDTSSTFIFIAVFGILLTLMENSRTGQAHAYADELIGDEKNLASR